MTRPGLRLGAALASVVASSAVPYGYTVTLWSSGALLMNSHGTPHVAEVFGFLAGALAGFGVIALVSQRGLGQAERFDEHGDRIVAGTLNVLATGGAVGVVALITEIRAWEAWPLGAFAATAFYLLMAGLQLALVTARRR